MYIIYLISSFEHEFRTFLVTPVINILTITLVLIFRWECVYTYSRMYVCTHVYNFAHICYEIWLIAIENYLQLVFTAHFLTQTRNCYMYVCVYASM